MRTSYLCFASRTKASLMCASLNSWLGYPGEPTTASISYGGACTKMPSNSPPGSEMITSPLQQVPVSPHLIMRASELLSTELTNVGLDDSDSSLDVYRLTSGKIRERNATNPRIIVTMLSYFPKFSNFLLSAKYNIIAIDTITVKISNLPISLFEIVSILMSANTSTSWLVNMQGLQLRAGRVAGGQSA